MKKLLSMFLLMSIVCCGIAYAENYDVNSSENAMGISELQGKTYITFTYMFIPYLDTLRFEESGNFISDVESSSPSYSGNYTQTGNAFNAHCEWSTSGAIHGYDYEGVSILDIFIFGSITSDFPGDESDMSGFFFGILKSIRKK